MKDPLPIQGLILYNLPLFLIICINVVVLKNHLEVRLYMIVRVDNTRGISIAWKELLNNLKQLKVIWSCYY